MNNIVNTMNVSIIIVNTNEKQLTINAINSIFTETSGVNFEVIVVDNHSSDDSIASMREAFSERITIIQASENMGFGSANNLGLKAAMGKYILFLNPDTLLASNAIQILYDYMETHTEVGVCGGNLFFADMTPNHSFSTMPSPGRLFCQCFFFFMLDFLRSYCHIGKRRDFNYSKKPREVGYITGADMMVRKTVLEKTGGFDPDFFPLYFEETELQFRIKKLGCLIKSVPQAKIIHLNGGFFGARDNFGENRFRTFTRCELLFYEKVYGKKGVKRAYRIRKASTALRRIATKLFFMKKANQALNISYRVLQEEYSKWEERKEKSTL
jgi:GT2 family glycosyltransferase